MQEFRDFLSLVSEGLLVVALPIVIAAAVQHYRVMTGRLADKLGEDKWAAIQRAITTGVQVAEQTGLYEKLGGPEKKKRAIQIAQSFLEERGITLDVEKVASLVEAEVLEQFSNPSVPADSPGERQMLIDKAVESAVLAAEQSGVKGLIENTSDSKRAYALNMANQYLNTHGIVLDEELVAGLLEAQLLRLVLAARGELPEL